MLHQFMLTYNGYNIILYLSESFLSLTSPNEFLSYFRFIINDILSSGARQKLHSEYILRISYILSNISPSPACPNMDTIIYDPPLASPCTSLCLVVTISPLGKMGPFHWSDWSSIMHDHLSNAAVATYISALLLLYAPRSDVRLRTDYFLSRFPDSYCLSIHKAPGTLESKVLVFRKCIHSDTAVS